MGTNGKNPLFNKHYFEPSCVAIDYLCTPTQMQTIKYVNREELKEICRKADAGEDGIKLSPWFRLVLNNFMYNQMMGPCPKWHP